MRLSREAKKVKKDFDAQIKKHGKITDNYVCAPDPEDPLTWYYVVFGLEGDFEGGYYFGKVVCPTDYPARPPYITVLTKNGHFVAGEKVCLSITDYHPESWNPAWTVTHVILGMISFWLGGEETAGSQYYYGNDRVTQKKNACIKFAMKSRESVLQEAKYQSCLDFYTEYIGIKNEVEVPAWKEFLEAEKAKKEAAEKAKIEAEKKKKEEEEKKALEEAKLKAEAEAKKKEEEEKAKVEAALKKATLNLQAIMANQPKEEDEEKDIIALFDDSIEENQKLETPALMRKTNSTPAQRLQPLTVEAAPAIAL